MPANDNHATRTQTEEDAMFDAAFATGDRDDAIIGISMMPRTRQFAFAERCKTTLLRAQHDGTPAAELHAMKRDIRIIEANAKAAPSDAFRRFVGAVS